MKLIIAALLLAAQAHAGPYFRPISPDHIQKYLGASVDPVHSGQSSAISEVALVTHSTADGCLMPSVICEDWSPLAVGPSYNAGRFAVVFGPVVNLAPAMRAGLISAIRAVSPLDADNADRLFQGYDGVTVAFGPQLWINPFRGGVFQPLNKWAPAGRIFVGLAAKLP